MFDFKVPKPGEPLTLEQMHSRMFSSRTHPLPKDYNFRTPKGAFMRASDVIGKPPERAAQLGPVIDEVRGHGDVVKWLGIKMIKMSPATLTFERIRFEEPFYIADTVFTNGHLKKLISLMPDEMVKILGDPLRVYEWSISFAGGEHALRDDCPVVGIGYYQADKITYLLGGSLPYPEQWLRAVRGRKGNNIFPWGDERPDRSRVIYGQAGTMPVKSLEAGKSPEGVYDLTGNVLEWTLGDFEGAYAVGRTSWAHPRIIRNFDKPLPVTDASRGNNVIGFRLFRLDEEPTSDEMGFREHNIKYWQELEKDE